MNGIVRLQPDARWMVTEPCGDKDIDLLCAECGWQGHATLPDAPWYVFQAHGCRLVAERRSAS